MLILITPLKASLPHLLSLHNVHLGNKQPRMASSIFPFLHKKPENCCRKIIRLYWLVPLKIFKCLLNSVPILLCAFQIIKLSHCLRFHTALPLSPKHLASPYQYPPVHTQPVVTPEKSSPGTNSSFHGYIPHSTWICTLTPSQYNIYFYFAFSVILLTEL